MAGNANPVNKYWPLIPHIYTIGSNTFGYYFLTGYNDALNSGVDCFGVLRAGTALLTFVTGPLQVAASDSAAASANVPVGGYYKTSAGVVMQRTT